MTQNGCLHKTGGTDYQSCMYPTDSAWPAFLMPFLLLLPVSGHLSRGFTVPPTKRAYSALHPHALTECSPLDFQRSSIINWGLLCIYIWLSAKRCACKGLCTSVENKTLLKTVFIWNVVLCTCINEWIYSTDNFSNQALVDFKIQSSHTEKAPKNDRPKRTSMYRVIFVTLLTNKSQTHGEPITVLYAKNIVLYG